MVRVIRFASRTNASQDSMSMLESGLPFLLYWQRRSERCGEHVHARQVISGSQRTWQKRSESWSTFVPSSRKRERALPSYPGRPAKSSCVQMPIQSSISACNRTQLVDHQEVSRRSSGGHQEVIRRSSGDHQEIIRIVIRGGHALRSALQARARQTDQTQAWGVWRREHRLQSRPSRRRARCGKRQPAVGSSTCPGWRRT